MASRGKTAQLHQMHVADFETCDAWQQVGNEIPNQRVWLGGYMNLEKMVPVYHNSLDSFMDDILSRGGNVNTEYAFHNLKFDGSFIIPWLFKNGFTVSHKKPAKGQFSVLIDERNAWYSITIQPTTKRRVTLWDSLKLFPTALEYLHETYGTATHKMQEDDAFYNLLRGEDHIATEEEISYLHNDLQVLAETLLAHIKVYGLRFKKTQASQAFYNFECHFPAWKLRFPPLDDKTDDDIRKAYWGGISHASERYAGKDMRDIHVYDINSSYPFQLAYKRLPYGEPLFKWGQGINPDMSKFWVAEALLAFTLKKDKLPCIPTKALIEGKPITWDHWLDDSEGIVRMRFCNIDYLTMLESYDIEILSWEWSIHWAWKVHTEIQTYILKNNDDKNKYKLLAKQADNIADRLEYMSKSQRAKINNNSFYGKFGEEVIKNGKTPYYEDGDIEYKIDRHDIQSAYKRKYLPVAIATTAWGRQQLTRMANHTASDFVYCDTDSVHIKARATEALKQLARDGIITLSATELGGWKLEGKFDRARFLRAKCYYEQVQGREPEVTIAGLPADKHSGQRSKKRSCITWDNFHIGLYIPPDNANKLGTRRTPTGNKLVPVGFEITKKVSPFYH